ncbi:MAG: sel1 repeat family protein [Planctomycetaceae bacterium]|nr:sel1 repeat family protein [Planctomycetaceae bacterium]
MIDTTGFMRTQADSSGLLLIKSNLQRSLRDLKEFHSFELLCFDSRISATFGQNAKAALVSADTSNLSVARERIENILPKPEEDEDISNDGDLKGAILAALALKPDTLFLICHSANAEQLNGVAQGEIRKAAAQTKLYAVEVANSIKPLYETPLEKLANNLGGDYQWLNILQKVSPRSRELNWSPDENVSIPSLTDMIDADFKFYGDVSRKETQGYSPFGKEVVAVRDRSPEGDGSLDSPKQLSLGDAVIREIETDARIVYLSGFTGLPQNPQMLRVGAENRLALWIQGAKAELPAAEYLIGLCYKNGVRVTPDEDKALQCQLKAALQGCLPAMFLVAMEYQARSEINSTDQNASTSVAYWVEKGAKLGEPFAQCYWANHFTHTLEERYIWLEKAARQELPEAQYLLGKCLETGSGTLADKSAAAVWYEKAAKQGLVAAQNALDKLKSDL